MLSDMQLHEFRIPAIALLISFFAAIACAGILRQLLASGLAWRLATDMPNDRSLHEKPTPRIGGWGIVPVIAIVILTFALKLWLAAAGALVLAAVSQIDDRRGLPARVRFAVHVAVVMAFVIANPSDVPWWFAAGIVFLQLWLTNLYNFMDGADGLAGGMALFGFGGYALAALSGGGRIELDLAFGSAAIAGAACGFLCFNFHPARLFLGDAGSIPLGFLAGALGYWGWRADVWPLWFPAMVFAPFIVDASITLLRRLLRGEKVWQAHREHYYQRMVRLGLGHTRTALAWYVIMLAGTMVAMWTRGLSATLQWTVCVVWYVMLIVIGAVIDLRWRRHQAITSK